jgi:hypothetical protein
MLRRFKRASLVGIVPAVLEFALVYIVDPTLSWRTYLQVTLFWYTCGVANYLIELRMPRITQAVVFTIFLNLPWYIAESIGKNKIDHLLPLLMASIVQGIIIGTLCRSLKKRERLVAA